MDLTQMSSVEPAEFVAELVTSDVVIAFWPDGRRWVIKGEYTLDEITRIQSIMDLSVLTVKVKNTTQVEFVNTALLLIQSKHDAPLWGRIFSIIGEMPELGQTVAWRR